MTLKYAKDIHTRKYIDYDLNNKTIQENGTKLDIVSEMIFDEAHYEGCVSYVLKENFKIERVHVDVLGLQIKVVK